jgi:hypothetical protein
MKRIHCYELPPYYPIIPTSGCYGLASASVYLPCLIAAFNTALDDFYQINRYIEDRLCCCGARV